MLPILIPVALICLLLLCFLETNPPWHRPGKLNLVIHIAVHACMADETKDVEAAVHVRGVSSAHMADLRIVHKENDKRVI